MNAFAYVPAPTIQLKAPTSAAAAAAAAAVAAAAAAAAVSIRTKKNRITECDLIPTRRSKPKSNLIPGKWQTESDGAEAGESTNDKRVGMLRASLNLFIRNCNISIFEITESGSQFPIRHNLFVCEVKTNRARAERFSADTLNTGNGQL